MRKLCVLGVFLWSACGSPAPLDLNAPPEEVARARWEGEACGGAQQCASGLMCERGRCQASSCRLASDPVALCAARLGLPARGVVCATNGQCVPVVESGLGVWGWPCAEASECGLGMVCDAGACAVPCNEDAQCPEGALCEATGAGIVRVCAYPERVCSEQDAPDAFCARMLRGVGSCSGGVCVPSDEPARCVVDEDCGQRRVCVDGACAQGCTPGSADDCAGLVCHERGEDVLGVCAVADWAPQDACTRAADPDLYCATQLGVIPAHARCGSDGACALVFDCAESPDPAAYCEDALGELFVPVCDVDARACVSGFAPRSVLWVQDETGQPVCDTSRAGEGGVDLTRLELRAALSGPVLGYGEALRFVRGLGGADASPPFDGTARPVDADACPVDAIQGQIDPARRMSLGCTGGAGFVFRGDAGELLTMAPGAFVDVGEYNPACVGEPQEERDVYSVWLCDALPSNATARSFEQECALITNGLLGPSRLAIPP